MKKINKRNRPYHLNDLYFNLNLRFIFYQIIVYSTSVFLKRDDNAPGIGEKMLKDSVLVFDDGFWG